jgi:EpsD family peptidyl-prolyl cis-trans isomerase
MCAVAMAVALAGCGKKQEAQAVVGQVVAHVGPDDVTQQEVDNELRLARVPVDKRSDAILKAALSRVIERKYLAQQAVAMKLDREPTVHLDLARARDQTLASAFMQRDFGSKASGISNAEISDYIQAHPAQFARRQLFRIEQVNFPLQQDMKAIAEATKDYKSLDQVEAKLKELGINYSRGPGTLDSATLPAELLKPLEARKPDDIFLLRLRQGASFFKVTSVEDKPLAGSEANGFAKRELVTNLARKDSQQSLAAALAAAKYEGDYARIMTAVTPAAGAQAPAAETPTEGEKPLVETPTEGEKPAAETQKESPKK